MSGAPVPPDPGALPLAGVRVVDFTRLLPGPWCTQMLGDLGADVVKVEEPGIGDYARFNPPTYRTGSVYFNSLNRNKRSAVLDLKNEADRQTARRLLAGADVVVESFRAGVPEKLGIDYATVAAENPRVVYCSITGFGNGSALGSVPGHDLAIQGVAGTLGRHLRPDGPPPMPTFQAGDLAAAWYALVGILAALIRRAASGRGCYLEVPMYDSVVACSNVALSGALARLVGYPGVPEMEPWGRNPRYNLYRTRDGKAVAVCLLEARAWRQFCEYIGREDLIGDESWADRHTDHGERGAAYRDAIAAFCLAHDRDELTAKMREAGIAICPVYSTDEAVQAAADGGLVQYLEHPLDGRIPYFHDPLARAGLTAPTRRPPPLLGEHTAEVRGEAARVEARRPAGG